MKEKLNIKLNLVIMFRNFYNFKCKLYVISVCFSLNYIMMEIIIFTLSDNMSIPTQYSPLCTSMLQ